MKLPMTMAFCLQKMSSMNYILIMLRLSFSLMANWSSTKFNFHTAWAQSFANDSQLNYSKFGTYKVRSVQAF